jgi:hypothetical protein
MRSFCLGFLFLALLHPCAFAAAPSSLVAEVPDAKVVGKGRLSFLFWSVYDATLFAPKGVYSDQAPYALQIEYFREIEGEDIAHRSLEEMRSVGCTVAGKEAQWLEVMRGLFPDVENGTVLTGVHRSAGDALFLLGGKPIGRFEDPILSKCFFEIWLNPKTSEPALRRALIGGGR